MSIARCTSLAVAAVFAAAAAAPAQPRPATFPLHILDVPYLAQTEALCGGAAAAMVMRYWGETGVYAESFADLVDRDAAGIRAGALVESLRLRGWGADAFSGTPESVGAHLAQGRPVIVLIEDRPGRYHYVVVVAWSGDRVLLHDPARAPFRLLSASDFTRAWSAAGAWAMLLLPSQDGPKGGLPHLPDGRQPPFAQTPCAGVVQEGIKLGSAGDHDGARRLFRVAADACPQDSAPWREMAGLHALRQQWSEAAADARRATALNPGDDHAWRILATAAYLVADERAALDAWNHLGEPIVDLVDVKGLDRTRYDVVADAAAIEPRAILTARALARARRRVRELPSVQAARVAYQPAGKGLARVDVVVFERPMLPTSRSSLAAAGVRLLSDREAAAALTSAFGGAETWGLAWRWWEHRPRVSLAFAAPTAAGVIRLVAFDEHETYGNSEVERRRGARLTLADWSGPDTKWDVSLGADRWRGRGPSPSIGAGFEQHAGGSLILSTGATVWPGLARTWSVTTGADWRSRAEHQGQVWLARAGVNLVGSGSPLGLWHAAGSGARAAALLRAHPVLSDGRVDRAAIGRRLVHGGVEWRRWFVPAKPLVRIAPAAFVDVARAYHGAAITDARTHVDAGAGLRFVVTGHGVVGLDLARGLRDGRMAVSIGFRR